MSSLKAKIANHILMQNDWMQTDLKKFAGNIILIKVSDIEIFFKINSEGQIFVIDSYEKPNVSIKMSLKSLFDQITVQNISDINILYGPQNLSIRPATTIPPDLAPRSDNISVF